MGEHLNPQLFLNIMSLVARWWQSTLSLSLDNLSGWLNFYSYETDSTQPTDVCVCHSSLPPDSTAAHPPWIQRSSVFRMGRVPSGQSECWHACWAFRRTSPPVARPRQTLCLHWLLVPTERQTEKWGLMQSVIIEPMKMGRG